MAQTSTSEVTASAFTGHAEPFIEPTEPTKPPGSPAMTPPSSGAGLTPGGVLRRAEGQPFEVHLDVFQGPFELLLGLISKHKLDITEIALAEVTSEFMARIRAHQASDTEWDLSQASEFLLVAATLLDIKSVSYTHLRAHETVLDLVCRL